MWTSNIAFTALGILYLAGAAYSCGTKPMTDRGSQSIPGTLVAPEPPTTNPTICPACPQTDDAGPRPCDCGTSLAKCEMTSGGAQCLCTISCLGACAGLTTVQIEFDQLAWEQGVACSQ